MDKHPKNEADFTAIEVRKVSPDMSYPFNSNNATDGVGNLLFRMHSVYRKPFLFAQEETSLQFYEHVGKKSVLFYHCFILCVHFHGCVTNMFMY